MPREIPDFPKDWQKPMVAGGHSYDIELITPMVGGGVSPGVVDLDFSIRPTAIRGHLRHWWRLAKGHLLGQGMWQREEEIFGSTDFPSPVCISVETKSGPVLFDPSDDSLVPRFGPVAYALFPSIENKQLVAQEGLQFQLAIRTPTSDELLRRRKAQNEKRKKEKQPTLPESISPLAQDLDAALAAWFTWGGIGGRTRRGCGAIRCQNLVNPLPQLPARIFVGSPQKSGVGAWKDALSVYRDFRQSPRGRTHQKTILTKKGPKVISVPGRSHWPEADSIRQITGCSLKPPLGTPPSGVPVEEDPRDHSTPVVPVNLLPSFPKAVLGLPINFHFADGPNKGNAAANLDPKDVQLYPVVPGSNGRLEKAERMASPVITRPIWKDGQWFPAIIVLSISLPANFHVRIEGRNAALNGSLAHDLPLNNVVSPSLGLLKPMRGKQNAIDSLIEFLTNAKKFTEVTP